MIVISDTTALTTLLKAGFHRVLPDLFGEVILPVAVADELFRYHGELPSWCVVRKVTESELLTSLLQAVDKGEAEAIALAIEMDADPILLDDKKGRRSAEKLHLTVLPLPAVMLAAKRNGFIPSLTRAMHTLAEHGNYRVAEQALIELLRSASEA